MANKRFVTKHGVDVNGQGVDSTGGSLTLSTNNTVRVTIDQSNGNVGIGTSTPGAALNVVGPMRSTRPDFAKIELENTTTPSFIVIENNAGALAIGTGSTASTTERVRITDGGVGIGTSSPAAALHIQRTSANANLQVQTTTANQAGLNLYNSVRQWRIISDPSNSGTLQFFDQTAAIERMRITDTGNVGIGITNPSARFQVLNGDNSSGAIRLSATGTTAGNFASMTYITGTASWQVGTEAGNGRFFIYNSQGGSDQLVFSGGTNSLVAINALGTGTIRLNTAGNNRVLITDTGRVGIQTQTPVVTLDVAGDINASSSLNVGFNRASDGSAVLDLQAQGGTGIDYNARLQRASGVDGALTLTNAGNGGLVLQTEGNGFVNIRQGNTSRVEDYINSQVFLTAANADNTTTLRNTTAGRQIALSFTHGTPTIAATNFIGSAGTAGQLVADSGQYDMVYRTNGTGMRWSVNDGTSSALVLSSTGGVSINNSPVSNTKLFVNGSVAQNVVAVAASDINWSQGNYFTRTISTATTFTFSNFPASGFAMITLKITDGGSASITWPTVKWSGGTPPTLTTNGIDIINFFTDDGGTTVYGILAGKGMA